MIDLKRHNKFELRGNTHLNYPKWLENFLIKEETIVSCHSIVTNKGYAIFTNKRILLCDVSFDKSEEYPYRHTITCILYSQIRSFSLDVSELNQGDKRNHLFLSLEGIGIITFVFLKDDIENIQKAIASYPL